ncbi:MAG: RluA family pseudouridine synthase [Planctomycetota bacterium]
MSAPSIEPNERVTFGMRYEDEHLLVVDKPARVVTQPGVGHQHDTLLNGLFAQHGEQLQQLGERRDFGLVHRLDRLTSGLVVVALNAPAYDGLRAQFTERDIKKFYYAVCHKAPKEPTGIIKRALLEKTERVTKYTSMKTSVISTSGKPAATGYRVLDVAKIGTALLEARPMTGRLHQVRVHLTSIGCAILGDDTYGPKSVKSASRRLALHAHRLVFEHPVTGEEMDVRSSLPKDLRALIRRHGLRLPSEIEAAAPDKPSP